MKAFKTGKRHHVILSVVLMLAVALTSLAVHPRYAEAAAKKKTKSVYVITGQTITGYYDIVYKNSFSYNKNGLITKIRFRNIDPYGNQNDDYKWSYKYDKKNRFTGSDTTYYKYDKKGRVKKMGDTTIKYSKKGYPSAVDDMKFSFNASGRLSKMRSGSDTLTISYDKKGGAVTLNRKGSSFGQSFTDKYKYENTYKSGRLTRQKQYYYNSNDGAYRSMGTIKYTYKKITVPAELADRIKAQQKWICLYGVSVCPGFAEEIASLGLESMYK